MMTLRTTFIAILLLSLCTQGFGQNADSNATQPTEAHTIVLTPGTAKPPAFLYAANARAEVRVGEKEIEQTIQLQLRIVQGESHREATVSLGLGGVGNVTEVVGESIASWSVRTVGTQRFLDLQWKPTSEKKTSDPFDTSKPDNTKSATIRIRSELSSLPTKWELAHLQPGKALGFDSQIEIHYAQSIVGKVVTAEGFAPLLAKHRIDRLQTATGGRLELQLNRNSALSPAVELLDTSLVGQQLAGGKSMSFQLRGNATVIEAGARLKVLSGKVALSELPQNADYRLELVNSPTGPVYEMVFPKAGNFPIAIDLVVAIHRDASGWQSVDFNVATSAVVPLRIQGLDAEIDFAKDQQAIVPLLVGGDWQGFLPATGQVKLKWQNAKSANIGKSFFTTNATIEATVGPGLLRQDHRIQYQLLQGQLPSLSINLVGPGEIINVEGDKIVAWKVVTEEEQRHLDITLNQPLTGTSQITVRSQTTLGAFPLRVEGLSLQPQGAIRSSGHLRISNSGSVSVEPTALRGLTQLAPEQFPGDAIQSRQLFVYRFPSSDYGFTIAADRVQPEVSITQLILYELSESDRVIHADIELDIREASIREWNVTVPADYSVVTVTGANVSDYMASTEETEGARKLKVLFGQDVQGRQLVSLRLEKNEVAASGPWNLPHILFPEAKSVRGEIGIVVAPGFRATVGSSTLLVEKPLAYFPRPVPNLQQAFRIRETGWSAVMQIERLERSIQSDMFHLYSLSQGTIYGSALVNYSVTGAPVAEWQLTVPATLGNVTVDGPQIRTWRREGDNLFVSLQQPILGAYTLLITFEEKPNPADGSFQAGLVAPVGVQGDRGYIEVVSPLQVEMEPLLVSSQLLVLDPLELPAEFRLLSTAPALGTWQYTQRPFDLRLKVNWFDPGSTAAQVVEFSEANSRVSQEGELVTDVLYYVKSRGQRTLKLQLPSAPVRLWAVSVNGQPVTARQAGDETWVPLPASADSNEPVEVSLRLGKPASDKRNASLDLPIVFAPVLKTQWHVKADQNHLLIPSGGNVEPTKPVIWPNGFDYLAARGLFPLIELTVLAILVAFIPSIPLRLVVLSMALVITTLAASDAWTQLSRIEPLQMSLPVLGSGEQVHLKVANLPSWRASISWVGVALAIGGIVLSVVAWSLRPLPARWALLWLALGLVGTGLLLQMNGAIWFFCLLGAFVVAFQIVPNVVLWKKSFDSRPKPSLDNATPRDAVSSAVGGEPGPVIATILAMFVGSAMALSSGSLMAADAPAEPIPSLGLESLRSATSVMQKWNVANRDKRLTASAEVTLAGQPGDSFAILRAPAVLTQFQGPGLRLSKIDVPNQGITYVVTIPTSDRDGSTDKNSGDQPGSEDGQNKSNTESRERQEYKVSFEYQLGEILPTTGIPVLTGWAALQQIDVSYDEASWEVVSDTAAKIETVSPDKVDGKAAVQAKILLGPGPATIVLRPQNRDFTSEETKFFVEGAGVYTPGPGVIDGKHRFKVRTSQGRVKQLKLQIPTGLTVSAVDGPVSSWQFDADTSRLQLWIEASVSEDFTIMVDTQRSLEALPSEIELAPLRVEGAEGEVGLIALAFDAEAQPENVQTDTLSLVNLGDFDLSLIAKSQATLHRVYRYGAEGGKLSVQVSPVSPEVRVASKQVISFGDERIVVSINLMAEITRTGLFQLSFPLPAGFEVESLTGESLHHWSEVTENGQRQIILHLKGKSMGSQNFALTLSGVAPTDEAQWAVPRFELNQATRQSGELIIQPITGIRLRATARQNITEADARSLGAQGQGALAFRLLQRDWNLTVGIEKLDAWVTGQVLHDVTLREGQTRTTLLADFTVQNAAIRSLTIKLPALRPEEFKTVRANGETVSDFVRSGTDESVWELRFKRRVIGPVRFQIEYERRGERTDNSEFLSPVEFPDAKQLGYYFAVRAGGRLEIEPGTFNQGWQSTDWSTVPQPLRDTGNRNAPVLAIRAISPTTPMSLRVIRHSLADALKLRVASGTLTTVLSPTGDQLTAVDIQMEVIQRSSLSLQLPSGGELFSIFVNGESVHSIRQNGNTNTWQFYILPGMDDRTAQVRFVYSLVGDDLKNLKLASPQLNVPLENIEWNVIAPPGFQLIDHDGNLELVGEETRESYDRQSYLGSIKGKRQDQAQQATRLLEQANQLLRSGEQSKAQWALNNVANRYALDAASNEDARVQLENLQTQRAVVGLNTRRQRLLLDSNRGGAATANQEQLKQAAAMNPILQQEQLKYLPQELSQLLAGNTKEENAILQQIAGRLVQHQRTTEPAPQAITISLPEEGTLYRFRRSVQVAESLPLELDLKFNSQYKLRPLQWLVLAALVGLLAASLAWKRKKSEGN